MDNEDIKKLLDTIEKALESGTLEKITLVIKPKKRSAE